MFGWLIRTLRRETTRDREYGPILVQGRQLQCHVCGHGIFWAYQIQLHTPLMTFLGAEAWNRLADCAVCARCGYIHSFIPPDSLPQEEGAEAQTTSAPDNAAT